MPQLVPLPAELAVVPRQHWDRRRSEPRYHCELADLGRLEAGDAFNDTRRCWVLDLSKHGAGLLLSQALEPGTLMVLHVKSTAGNRTYALPGHVVHATTQVVGDWLIGIEFADPLGEDDLDALL